MSDEVPIKLVNLVTGEVIPDATYRFPQHHYNGGFVADGCVYIPQGHAKYDDDKFHPMQFYVDKEKGVLVGRLTACGCGFNPCKACMAYYQRDDTKWWLDDLSVITKAAEPASGWCKLF